MPIVRMINVNPVCYKDNYFPNRRFELFNSLFHFLVLLFSIANMFAVRYLSEHGVGIK